MVRERLIPRLDSVAILEVGMSAVRGVRGKERGREGERGEGGVRGNEVE